MHWRRLAEKRQELRERSILASDGALLPPSLDVPAGDEEELVSAVFDFQKGQALRGMRGSTLAKALVDRVC